MLITSCRTNKGTIKYYIFSCEEGITEAIKDANSGKYELISYGLISVIKTDGFKEFYREYLVENYGIILSLGGCVVLEGSKCYREKIKELIYEEYGNDIFEVAKLGAIDEFRKTKEFIRDIKPEMDSGKVYWSWILHKQPRFIIENKEIDFIEYLGFADFEVDHYNKKNYCEISFIIEKNGVISDVKFKNAETREPIINDALMIKINGVHKWESGIYLGEVVRSSVSFDVPIRLIETYPR
ncbi:hypothetical protein [uncultured Winogradskyella sp.]|uniref:hypothetical protein n=1 Tax=uncultured Winogradskyella sp. TaxID=395353 RepID=UPI00262503C5|nr:hypothetical protein [uncultured Winogradskyella sp.]